MAERQGKKTRIRVTDCRHVYSGVNQRGDSYNIFEIDAVRPADSERIKEKLRSFTALPIGQVIDVTVVPFNSTRHGRSFTVYPEQGPKPSTTQAVNELQQMYEDLRKQMQALRERVELLEARGTVGTPPATPPPTPAAEDPALDAAFGADAPF